MKGKLSPKDRLLSVNTDRTAIRSVLGAWASKLSSAEQKILNEYIDVYRELAEIGIPDLAEALRTDECLGSTYPKVTNESLGKWVRARYGKETKS